MKAQGADARRSWPECGQGVALGCTHAGPAPEGGQSNPLFCSWAVALPPATAAVAPCRRSPLQEPPFLSVTHAGRAHHVPDTQGTVDEARARLSWSCCACKGYTQDTGLTYLVTSSGDHNENTEHRPRVKTVCVARKRGPPPLAPVRRTGIGMWPLGKLLWLGTAKHSLLPGSGTEARAGVGGQWLRHLQDTWCAWGGHPVLPGQAMSSEGRRHEPAREREPVTMRNKSPKPVWP